MSGADERLLASASPPFSHLADDQQRSSAPLCYHPKQSMHFPRYLLALASIPGILSAQVNPPAMNSNAAAAYESLLRLRTTATVLHTPAHPDDEDGALLTWLTRSQGVRTGLFTLTRGEGGADLTGPELFDALGLVRTEELLA